MAKPLHGWENELSNKLLKRLFSSTLSKVFEFQYDKPVNLFIQLINEWDGISYESFESLKIIPKNEVSDVVFDAKAFSMSESQVIFNNILNLVSLNIKSLLPEKNSNSSSNLESLISLSHLQSLLKARVFPVIVQKYNISLNIQKKSEDMYSRNTIILMQSNKNENGIDVDKPINFSGYIQAEEEDGFEPPPSQPLTAPEFGLSNNNLIKSFEKKKSDRLKVKQILRNGFTDDEFIGGEDITDSLHVVHVDEVSSQELNNILGKKLDEKDTEDDYDETDESDDEKEKT